MRKKVVIIGSGISGISAAAYASKAGHEVHVFEKNEGPGGRASQLVTNNGYTFDMGPSWYWMPDIINNFFQDFGRNATDFYDLVPLDPQFEILFRDGSINMPRNYDEACDLFESIEPGAGKRFDLFMQAAKYKYDVGMRDFVTKPCHSWMEFASPKIFKSAMRLDLLTNYRRYVKKYFRNQKLVTLMEFPVIFLGASPKKIPALYSMMNYGGYVLGTWYPMGGFFELVKAMKQIAEACGAVFHFDSPVEKINHANGVVTSVDVAGQSFSCDALIASADYAHTESMLEEDLRNYPADYWTRKTFAPSCLIYYMGFKRKLPNLKHHTLFFEHDLDQHIDEIYEEKKWPEQPLFYACCPSKTDPSVAPQGRENLFLLMPLPTGIDDDDMKREFYFTEMLSRLEKHTGMQDLASLIDYKRSYGIRDFMADYHACQGNAYGLANTLAQTAVLKPSMRNKKLPNLFYAGQLTVPGPGVPPSIISGKIAAIELNNLKTMSYEKTV